MLILNESGWSLSRSGRLLLLLLGLVVPSVATAELHIYKGTLEVKETSGALCGINHKKVYPIEVVLDQNGSGIDGYFHGRDLSAGRFKGTDLRHLKVSYPYDDAGLAEGHAISLLPTHKGLMGELREKHLSPTAANCSFDSASLTLVKEFGRDGETAWKEAAAVWQMELYNRRTNNFLKSGSYAEAVAAAQYSLTLAERHFGPASSESSVPLSNLAVLYRTLGRHAEAEPICRRVLEIAEKTLGPEHQTVGIRLINLAELYESTARYSEAEPLYHRALAIYEKALGPEHPDLAIVLNNLAVLYQTLGRHPDAEPLLERAMAIMQKGFGPSHPSVMTLRGNLEELRKKDALKQNRDATSWKDAGSSNS